MSKIEQQLKEMAQLTVLSNRVSELQEHNLKMFPLVFFDNVKSIKIEYDLERKKTANDETDLNNSIVSYYMKIESPESLTNIDKRFEALQNSVRTLFWSDVTVEVYFNGKIVFKSGKHEQE